MSPVLLKTGVDIGWSGEGKECSRQRGSGERTTKYLQYRKPYRKYGIEMAIHCIFVAERGAVVIE